MKFLPLLLANLGRKKVRTALSVGSFAVALFLFGLLAALRAGFRQGIDVAGADRLVVIGRTSIIQPLPRTYLERIRRQAGVRDVAYATWFGGVYQDPKNFFAQFAIDPEGWRRLYPEFVVEEDAWRAFVADRQGCVVGEKLARRYGWKVGDRIPLKGTIFGDSRWEFNVRAVYRGSRRQDDESQFWMQQAYLVENGPDWWRGLVGWYVVRVADPADSARVARAIDAEFANSPSETRTQTEAAFATAFVQQMGNVEFLVLVIGALVFFTLLLVTGNTMATAVRERVGEQAVLKAIGCPDGVVMGLVLAESLVIASAGGLAGLVLARAVVGQDLTKGLLLLYLSGRDVAAGAALALAMGMAAALVPALSARRLTVVEGLRRA
jgi:putative ABC transport system permease protein